MNAMCEHVLPQEYTSITQKKHTWNPGKQFPILCLQSANLRHFSPLPLPWTFPAKNSDLNDLA